MKHSYQRLFAWWFAILVPAYAPLTTIDEREKLRKRRLLSILVLIVFMLVFLFLIQGFFNGAPITQQGINASGCGIAFFVLWLNKRGYLKTAGFLYVIFSFILSALLVLILSSRIPVLSLFLWALFLNIPVMTALFLPAWGSLFISFLEIVFMCWFVLSERHRQIVSYIGDPGVRLQFLFFIISITLSTGIYSTIYTITTKKAVLQADRATELEQAHQAISSAYAELEQVHGTIQRQALTDGLTGLPNHRSIMDYLTKELGRTRRYDHPFSLLFFDADHFKHVNDTYGHAAGDAVLRQIGERASSAIRVGDMLGRFGGEEFVVLLPETDSTEATIVAERIRAAVADGVVAHDEIEGGIAMTVSIGIATYLIDGTSEQELLSQADEAMYLAKRMGRNQIRTAEETRELNTHADLMVLLQKEGQLELAQRAGITLEQLRETYVLRSVHSLLSLLERRDADLRARAHSVSDLATKIALEAGLATADVSRIGTAALLHDIGKVGLPDTLLQKTSLLTLQERIRLQEHAELGAQILEASPILSNLAAAVRHHHEHWDGQGYPGQLAGEDIPLEARILAVAEAYDELQHESSYPLKYSSEETLTELRRCAGTQFDPTIVQILALILVKQSSLLTVN